MSLTKVSYSMINGVPLNVKDFGAVGDGVTDDTTAIQAALDTPGPFGGSCIYFPPGKYRITQTLNITLFETALVGESISKFQSGSEIILDSGTPQTMFTTINSDHSFQNLKFTSTRAVGYKTFVIGPTSGVADRDVWFDSCYFEGGTTAIEIYGRGLYLDNCSFGGFDQPIVVDWPNPFTPNPDPDATATTGFRAYVVRNCRFHACTGYAIKNVGYNQENFTGLVFTGNFSDTATGLFWGGARNCVFTGNNFFQVWLNAFQFLDVDNVVVSGNNISGMYQPSEPLSPKRIYDIETIVACLDGYTTKGLLINGNTFSSVYKNGVLLDNTWSNVTVTNNVFNDILRGNGDINLSPTYAVVRIQKAGSGLNFSDNTVITDGYTRNEAIVYADAGSNVLPSVTNWVIRGNFFVPAYIDECNLNSEISLNTDVHVQTYAGDGTTKVIALPFQPKAVVVTCNLGALLGQVFANVVGTVNGNGVEIPAVTASNSPKGVEIAGNANAVGNNYSLMAWK
jgi:hypothetical protein